MAWNGPRKNTSRRRRRWLKLSPPDSIRRFGFLKRSLGRQKKLSCPCPQRAKAKTRAFLSGFLEGPWSFCFGLKHVRCNLFVCILRDDVTTSQQVDSLNRLICVLYLGQFFPEMFLIAIVNHRMHGHFKDGFFNLPYVWLCVLLKVLSWCKNPKQTEIIILYLLECFTGHKPC